MPPPPDLAECSSIKSVRAQDGQLPQFAVVRAGPSEVKHASAYLSDKDWVLSLEGAVREDVSAHRL